MLLSNQPTKVQVPFANSGTKNTIPVASQIGITAGAASYTDGFPPLTFTPIASGGVPPSGADFNGIFNAITALLRWQSGGGHFTYDSSWSSANGGYAKGALLLKVDGSGFWFNTTDSNTVNPDTVGTGWSDFASAFSTPLASTADVQAGTSSTKAVTPAAMQAGKIVQSASVATTSGSAIDFVGIPPWAKRVTLLFKGVSLSGTSELSVRLGTSAGFVTSGYASQYGYILSANTSNTTSSTTGFYMTAAAAAVQSHGRMTFTLMDAATNTWVQDHVAGDPGGGAVHAGGGSIVLPGPLTQVRILSANGTDTFDNGSASIIWE